MVSDTQSNTLTAIEASELRQQAHELLNRLVADREQSERRIAETGKRDPMKFITGRTALDSAIASTREMIGQMDTLLASMNDELTHAEATPSPFERSAARFQPLACVRGSLAPSTPSLQAVSIARMP